MCLVILNFRIVLVYHDKRIVRCHFWKLTLIGGCLHEKLAKFVPPILQNIASILVLRRRFQNTRILVVCCEVNLFQSSVILTFVGRYSLIIIFLCLIMVHDVFHLFGKHFVSQQSLALNLWIRRFVDTCATFDQLGWNVIFWIHFYQFQKLLNIYEKGSQSWNLF